MGENFLKRRNENACRRIDRASVAFLPDLFSRFVPAATFALVGELRSASLLEPGDELHVAWSGQEYAAYRGSEPMVAFGELERNTIESLGESGGVLLAKVDEILSDTGTVVLTVATMGEACR
jgi:hypothetical protein